jgi:hypothetical protein
MASYPQYMVFYYLTPKGFRRYSSSNLCPALSCPGRNLSKPADGGIWLVNPLDSDLPQMVISLFLGEQCLSRQEVKASVETAPKGRNRSVQDVSPGWIRKRPESRRDDTRVHISSGSGRPSAAFAATQNLSARLEAVPSQSAVCRRPRPLPRSARCSN